MSSQRARHNGATKTFTIGFWYLGDSGLVEEFGSVPSFEVFWKSFRWIGIQFSSVAQSCLTLCDPMNCSTPGLPVLANSQSLPKLMSIESVMPSRHLIFCRSLLLLPSIFPSIRVFSNRSALCIRWPKYWSFNISPSNEHPGLISFRMNWLDLLAVQETLESSPTSQFKSINSSAFSFLYSPALTYIHDYWKTSSFD